MSPLSDMRRVTVSVATKDGKDSRAVTTYVEVDRGAGMIRASGRDLVCNKEEGVFDLKPGERLVIEGFPAEEIQYDRDQSAAYRPSQQDSGAQADKPTKEQEDSASKASLEAKVRAGETLSPDEQKEASRLGVMSKQTLNPAPTWKEYVNDPKKTPAENLNAKTENDKNKPKVA